MSKEPDQNRKDVIAKHIDENLKEVFAGYADDDMPTELVDLLSVLRAQDKAMEPKG